MMMELMTRKKRTQLMLIFTCAFGCTCASISGTLAALNHGADLHLKMPDQRPS